MPVIKLCYAPLTIFYLDLAYNKSSNEPGDSWIGYLDVEKIFSFNPYDYYKYTKGDIMGKPLPENYFASKERLTETGKRNIVGLQAAMWEEKISARPGYFGMPYAAAKTACNGRTCMGKATRLGAG